MVGLLSRMNQRSSGIRNRHSHKKNTTNSLEFLCQQCLPEQIDFQWLISLEPVHFCKYFIPEIPSKLSDSTKIRDLDFLQPLYLNNWTLTKICIVKIFTWIFTWKVTWCNPTENLGQASCVKIHSQSKCWSFY